jgi:ribosome recycling factor
MASETLQNIEHKMRKSVEVLQKELATIRTGRASPGLIEHLKVEYAGVPTSLNQLASISTQGAKLLVVQPWDRSSIDTIEKAIMKSDLGLNPVNDGRLIRINIPPLTEERRHELTRVVRRRVEEGRVAIRNLRREAMDELKQLEKNKDISQDEHKRILSQLQMLTDSFIDDIDQIGQSKEAEIMEV